MAEVDTSMYRPAPPANPLGVVHEFATAQNQLNQAKTFQMEFAARQALGPMLKASIQPDGSLDTAKLFQMVAAHPATGWKLPDLVEGFLKNELTTADIAKKHLEMAGTHFTNMGNVATGIVANAKREGREWITPEEYTAGMARGIPMGLYGGKDLVALFKGNPDLQPLPAGDPREHERNKRLFTAAFSMANASHDANHTINTTLGMQPLSEAEAAKLRGEPMQVFDPERGAMITAPRGAFMPTPAAGPAGGFTPGGTMMPPQAAPSEVEKGKMEALSKYNEGLDARAKKALDVQQVVKELRETMSHAKGGAGASFYAAIAKLLQATGVSNEHVDKAAGGNLAALQEADKLYLQNAVGVLRQQLLSTAGEGSAGRLALAEFNAYLKANPNIDMDPRAVKRMLDFTEMLSKGTLYEQKKFNEALEKHGPGRKMWNWQQYWNEQLTTNPKLRHFMELPPWEEKGGK